MGRRSRSRSPYTSSSRRRDRDRNDKDRDRDRERERERDRHRRKRSKDRSRDREPRRRGRDSHEHESRRRYSRSLSRSRSRSLDNKRNSKQTAIQTERPIVTPADLEGKSADEQEMMKLMGFCSFDSTKGKKVEGNDVGGVHVILKRKYRQYMNRKGGFNRPLDFVA